MGPLGFLTGVVLGSAAGIATVLSLVLIIFLLVSSDQPSLIREYAPLGKAVVLFAVLAAVAAIAFIGLQRKLAWRWAAQLAMWATLAGIAWLYWPKPLA